MTLKIDQQEVANLPESLDNILDSLEMTAMFELKAHKGPLGFFVSPIYYKGKASQHFEGLLGQSRKISLAEEVWAIDYGVFYKIGQWSLGESADSPTVTVEPYAGALYLRDNIKIAL